MEDLLLRGLKVKVTFKDGKVKIFQQSSLDDLFGILEYMAKELGDETMDFVVNPEYFKLEETDGDISIFKAVGPVRQYYVHAYGITMASFIDMIEKEYYNYQDSPLFTELKR